MWFFILIPLAMVITFFFPGAAKFLAWFITLFLNVPLIGLSAGVIAWGIGNALGHASYTWGSFGTYCLIFGTPPALLVIWATHSD